MTASEIEKLRTDLANALRELEKLKRYTDCLRADIAHLQAELAFELTQRPS